MTPSVLHVITSAARRGAEVHAVALDAELSSRGVRSRVVALERGRGGLDVEVLGPSSLSPRSLWELRKAAAGVDVVVAHGARTLPASGVSLAGTSTPFVYRSIGDPEAWLVAPSARVRTRLLLQRAVGVVALWNGAADRLAVIHRLPRDRVTVIPNAVVPSAAPSVPVPESPRIAFVGSLSEEKRPTLAIDVAHELGIPILVAGDGPLLGMLQHRAADRDQDVTFLGNVIDVDAVYDRSSVLVLTSRTEGQPAVLVEAALRRRASVATSVGGVPAMIEHGRSGMLVPSSPTVAEVAAATAAVIERAPAMGTAAHHRLGRTAVISRVADAWVDVLRQAVVAATR